MIMKKRLLSFLSLVLCALVLIHVEGFPIVPDKDDDPDPFGGKQEEEILPCDDSEVPGQGKDDF